MKALLLAISLITILFPCASQAQSFGKWQAGLADTGDAYLAGTASDNGSLLAQYCDISIGRCIWLLGMQTICEEGDRYPLLVNSDVGANHLFVYCDSKLDNGLYRYVFSDFDSIDGIVIKGSRVGFAFPLEDNQFRVIRFDLNGSNRAIDTMHKATEKARKKSSSKTRGSGDQDL